MNKVKWAIWGTGHICSEFAEAMEHVPNGELCCVLSRTQEKAEAFAEKYGIPKAYADADEMLAESGADIVYIGTPNRAHYKNMQLCIKYKKHMLCEKPMVINSTEMTEILDEAQKANVFLMEGMWTLFFPTILKVKEWIHSGKIGKVLRTNMNFSINATPGGWRLGSDMAGGAIMDLGIYCLTISDIAFGMEPAEVKSTAMVQNGVDIANSVILKYSEDQIATFTCAQDCLSDNKALIQGEKGFIEIRRKFWCPSVVELFVNEEMPGVATSVEVFEDPYVSTGFQYEAAHVGELVLNGAKASPVMPHNKSIQLIRLMDELRESWGIDID